MRTAALRKTLHRASAAADAALHRYALQVRERKLLAHTHNTTYRLTLRDGTRTVLKIRQPATDERREMNSEMQWIDALSRQTDLLVPAPIRNRSGELITEVRSDGGDRPHLCRVMNWVPGRRLSRGMKTRHMGQLGELIGGLHEHAGRWRPPRGFVRLHWDEELERRWAHVIVAARQGRLKRERMKVFEGCIRRARRAMRRFGRDSEVYRLIHADLGFTNHVFHGGRAGALDFEGCGYGYLLHDLAEPLVFARHVKHFASLRDALFAGYRRVRPMPVEMERLLPDFIDFSAMTSLGYVCREPSRAGDLEGISRYLAKVLQRP